MGVESTLPICPPGGPIWACVGELQPGCPWGLLWLLEECPGLKAIIFLFPECSVCLRERSKEQGRGKKVAPCVDASICLSATASLFPSVFLPLSLYASIFFSLCLYPCLSLLCLCVFLVSASISLSRSLCFHLSLSLLLLFLIPSSLPPPFLFLLPF